ncbi:CRISPR-associated endonuclease Cas1 [Anaerovibrio lipolyticus]|uniref:CRISPR-associated endonuclease Cas1 n=1 Tax=Anaerovibrio lipolyticus TaxID=82374 RepID=UPI0026EB2E1D|nr:CRISPR-associated endonuclease Cas1 [Anaerovibrio lipolyticus]
MSVLYLISNGSMARKDGGRIIVEKNGELVSRLPLRTISSILVGANAQISTSVIFACLSAKIPIFFLDRAGHLQGQLIDEKTTVSTIRKQCFYCDHPKEALSLATFIVEEKIRNQYNLLKGYTRTVKNDKIEQALLRIKAEKKNISNAKNTDELRGIEGHCAKAYFVGIGVLLNESGWQWKERSRKPAKDEANALLNFGYAFLEREVRISIISQGLDTRLGILHSSNGRKDSLVYDLMELFRQPVIDRFVFKLLRLNVFKVDDFTYCKESGYRLTDEARVLWYQRYEEYMERIYSEYGGLSPREMIQKRVQEFRHKLMY